MEDFVKCFSNKILFYGDVDPTLFSPVITFTGVIDSYGFNFVNELLAIRLCLKIIQRNDNLCNKCSILICDNKFNVSLEFGYRNSNLCIKKGILYIGVYSPDSTVKAIILLPPYCNYMDVKILNFNLIFPECNCFFADVDMELERPYSGSQEYMFLSPLQ